MGRIIGMIKKEFIHFYRDPVAMGLIIYHFTACILLCGYCWVVDVKHLPTAIYDMNRSALSRDLIDSFLSNEYFDQDCFVNSMAEIEKKLDGGRVKVALIIPPEFSRNILEGKRARIQILSDGSDANQAGQAIGFAKRIISTYNEKIVIERLKDQGIVIQQLPHIDNSMRILFNQEMEGVYYVVIFHIVIAGLIGGLLLSSTALVREKERGTIDQLMVTPTRTWEILLAKTIAPLMIGLIATNFSFLVVFWFDVPCRGNPLTFYAFMALFLLGTSGIGILIGVFCKNMLQSILLSVAVWFAGLFLAGIVTPLENMAPLLEKIGRFLPTTHFNIATNAIFQKGMGFSVLWPEALKLTGIGILLLAIGCFVAWRQFRQ